MVRTLLVILIFAFSKISYSQQFFTDQGTPILPPVPCNCNNWHNQSKDKPDTTTTIINTENYVKDGKKWKRVYYLTRITTTWNDICDDPANCKGAKRRRVTTDDKYWQTDEEDCGTLKSDEVCCDGKPVDTSKCCKGKILKDGEKCCDEKTEYPWDKLSIEVAKKESWWEKVIESGNKVKNVMKKLPWKIELEGPKFSGEYKIRDCCKDGSQVSRGESESSGTLSIGLKAEDVPCLSPPWTASYRRDYTQFGYTFEVEFNYGLLLSVSAELTGKISYNSNECTKKNCLNTSFELKTPLSLAVKGSIKACLKKAKGASICKGKNKDGTRCGNPTLYVCGYCYLHLNQSWLCTISCPQIKLNLLGLSTTYTGTAEDACRGGWKYSFSIGDVTIEWPGITFGTYTLSFPSTIIKGMNF